MWIFLIVFAYFIAGQTLYILKNVVATDMVRWWTVIAWPYMLAAGKYPKAK